MDQVEILDVFVLAERLHRQFLDSIQLELDMLNIRDINNVRALMLLNIGEAEMTVSELLWRGCYLGSNVSYNLKKLTEAGYVIQERSSHDKRVIMVRNSPKGMELCGILQAMNERHIGSLKRMNFKDEDLNGCRQTLRTLQRVWSQGGRGEIMGAAPYPASGETAARSEGFSPPRSQGGGHGGGGAIARPASAYVAL